MTYVEELVTLCVRVWIEIATDKPITYRWTGHPLREGVD